MNNGSIERLFSLKNLWLILISISYISCSTIPNNEQESKNKLISSKKAPPEKKKQDNTEKKDDLSNIKRILPSSPDILCSDSIYGKYLQNQYMKPKNKRLKNIRSRSYRKHLHNRYKRQARYHAEKTLNGPKAPYFGGVPVVKTPLVKKWMHYYTTRKGRRTFTKWLIRSRTYEKAIIPLLKKEGVPKELFFLAMIESGFNNVAYSRASATGTWQFMKPTARLYGLKVNHWVDERRDLFKSTLAAARYLRDLYGRFDDWYLAIAAYNAGPGKIQRAIRKVKSRDYWKIAKTRYIRAETKHYVPKMLAALIIASNLEEYGFHISHNPDDFIPQTTVEIKRPLELREIATKLGVSYKQIKRWNPEITRNITPPLQKKNNYIPYALRLPPQYSAKFNEISDTLSVLEIKNVLLHKIRRGDTLGGLARKYKIKVRKIISLNPKIRARALRIGRKIAIPIPAIIKKKTPKKTKSLT